MNGWPETAGHPDLSMLAAADLQDAAAASRSAPAASVDANSVAEIHPPAAIADGTLVQNPTGLPAVTVDIRSWTKAIRRGDEAAFTRFYDSYSLRLYRQLLVVGRGNETEAREVLQIVVIKLAKRFKVFDDEQQMWRWLCRLAQNAYIDFWRSQRRDRRLIALEMEAHDLPSKETSEGEHQLAAALHDALTQFEPQEQELLRSAYIDRRSLQELADESGQTYKAMESRLGRLRQKLKASLLNFLRHENR